MRTLGLSLFVLCLATIMVVSSIVAQSEPENNLAGTQWRLVSYGTPDNLNLVVSQSTVTLDFHSQNEAIGRGGCNGFSGDYTVDEDTLLFGQIVSTLMACDDSAVMEQEQVYFDALEAADRYVITSDQLTIWYEEGQKQLNFIPFGAYALQESQWRLASFEVSGETVSVLTDSVVTLEFHAENQASGLSGCNQYGGTYLAEDEAVSFVEMASTLMACDNPDLMDQEQHFLDALQSATRYDMSDNQLTIWYDDGQSQLHFDPYGTYALRVGDWQLVSFGPSGEETTVIAASHVTLDFGRNDQVSGVGGCNQFSSSYTIEDDTISFSEVVSTRMDCGDSDIMSQEQAFFGALQSAARYELIKDQLTIWYADGQLHFTLSNVDAMETDMSDSDQ